jgi:MEDS: MEthanogen/methylotroph, DcmR Sensory domain
MTTECTALLANPHPCAHIVYPYVDENHVEQAVSLFAGAGLRNGEGVILIMTADHCEPITHRLQREGFNVAECERSGQLTRIGTEDFLARLTANGTLKEDLFRSTIHRIVERARAAVSNGNPGKVRIFGEMVSQLRCTSLVATTRLEELWNDVIDEQSVSLLCTYALQNMDEHLPKALIELHSRTITAAHGGS